MSQQPTNNKPLTAAQQRKQQEEDAKKKAKRDRDAKNVAKRGSATAVATAIIVSAQPQNNIITPISALPQVPSYIQDWELIQTDADDFQKVLTNLAQWAHEEAINWVYDATGVYANYHDVDAKKSCKVVIKSYQQNNTHVFYAQRVEGCGIAFSRFYKQFNQQFGNTKCQARQINTFEPPALAFPACSAAHTDGCLDKHQAPPSAITWAVENLSAILMPVYKTMLTAAGASADVLSQLADVEDISSQQQAQTIEQSLALLNNTFDYDAEEQQVLTQFKEKLLDNVGEYNMLQVLLNMPSKSVFAAVMKFIAHNGDIDLTTVEPQITAFAENYVTTFPTLSPIDQLDYQDALASYNSMC